MAVVKAGPVLGGQREPGILRKGTAFAQFEEGRRSCPGQGFVSRRFACQDKRQTWGGKIICLVKPWLAKRRIYPRAKLSVCRDEKV